MNFRQISVIGIYLTAMLLCANVGIVQVSAKVPPRPEPAYAVNDFASIFTSRQRTEIERTLVSFAERTSNQIVVVTVNDLDGYEPAMYAYEIGEKWGVGSSTFDNGVVVLVKPKTMTSKGQVYIAVGYGLEGVIPDAIAKRIVENEMIPHFRENDYYTGVAEALKVIMSLAEGEYSAQEYADSDDSDTFAVIIVLLFVILLILGIFKGRGPTDIGGHGSRRSSVADAIFWGTLLGGSGRSGGGGFRGGFGGGFGGGSFGGGGAGGSW